MFDFPTAPTEDQVYDAPNGPRYIFKSPAWRVNPLPAAPASDGKTYGMRNAIWVDQGWRVIADLAPVSLANIDFVIPSDITMMKISGGVVMSSNGAQIGLRFSSNNGSSYYAGATDYQVAYISHQTATVNSGAINSTYLILTASADVAGKMLRVVNALVNLGVPGVQHTNYRAHSDGYGSSIAASTMLLAGSTNYAAARPTNGRIVTSAGLMFTGSRLIVEGV